MSDKLMRRLLQWASKFAVAVAKVLLRLCIICTAILLLVIGSDQMWAIGSGFTRFWLLLIGLAAVAACLYGSLRLPDWWRQKRAVERARAGLCPACGYDLHATLGRCPECDKRAAPG